MSLAGPLSNFVAAGLLGIPIKLGSVPYINPFSNPVVIHNQVATSGDYVGLFLTSAVYFNCILGVFNLIPIHPLDGFKVAVGLLPDELSQEFAKLGQYGPGILMILIVLPFVTGISPLTQIMGPTVASLVHFFTGIR